MVPILPPVIYILCNPRKDLRKQIFFRPRAFRQQNDRMLSEERHHGCCQCHFQELIKLVATDLVPILPPVIYILCNPRKVPSQNVEGRKTSWLLSTTRGPLPPYRIDPTFRQFHIIFMNKNTSTATSCMHIVTVNLSPLDTFFRTEKNLYLPIMLTKC